MKDSLCLLLLVYLIPSNAADCNMWTFLCEHETIDINDSTEIKPIRMPLTSADCNKAGAIATCRSILMAKLGQKMLVETGILFEVGPDTTPCDSSRNVMFESRDAMQSKADKACGKLPAYQRLFESVQEMITLTYTSNSIDDAASLMVTPFGCAKDSFVAGNEETSLELTNKNFGPSDERYEGLLKCAEGYLMPGNVKSKLTYCHSFAVRGRARRDWRWDGPTENTTCNRVTCEQLIPPVNGKYELSNHLYHNSEAIFSCGAGYTLQGAETQKCIVEESVGGFWSGIVPTCRIVDCGLPVIENATYDFPATYTYQSTFEYICVDGWYPYTAKASCTANGTWQFIPCQAVTRKTPDLLVITCPPPAVESGWRQTSSDKSEWLLGEFLTYTCSHDNKQTTIYCKIDPESQKGMWDTLDLCQPQISLPPIERIRDEPKPSDPKHLMLDKAAIAGGMVAGVLLAIVVVIVACVIIRRSRARKRESRKNAEEDKQRQPLTTPADANNSNCNGDVEGQTEGVPVAAVVKHFYNRGNNNKYKNGMNGSATVRSHKSSESSIELLETGDLYDSVMNGGYDKRSGSYGRKFVARGDGRSGGLPDRKSGEYLNRKSSSSTNSRSAPDSKSNGSVDSKSISSRKLRQENGDRSSTPKMEDESNGTIADGVIPLNKQRPAQVYNSKHFF